MSKIFFRFIFLSLAVLAADYLVNGISVDTVATALIAGAILAIIHTIIKPIVRILTLPITIITLGLFLVVLNVVFFWFVSDILPGMYVADFMAAFWGSLIVSVLTWIADSFSKTDKK